MAMVGMATMNGASRRSDRPEAMSVPHVDVGGSTLAPRMAAPPSATTATAMPSSEMEAMAGNTLGRISRNRILRLPPPWARAAVTKSRLDQLMVDALVMRARIGMLTSPRAMVTTSVDGMWKPDSLLGSPFNTATSDSTSTRAGMANKMSNRP